jgi:7-cyano-7-deazaguanine synthase
LTTALVLLSGGLDSTACAFTLKQQGFAVSGIFVDFGQPAAAREREASAAMAKALNIELTVRSIGPSYALGDGELPGRNALLISLAVFELGTRPGLVAIGVHAGTRYYDCSVPFIEAMNQLVQEQTDSRVAVTAPFVTWTKAEVYRVFQDSGIDVSETYSCEAGPVPCGECLSCQDRASLKC